MAQTRLLVPDYMARLKELGEREGHTSRFYVAVTDEMLLDMEERLIAEGSGVELHTLVLALYRRWQDAMGTETWAEVWAHNESLGTTDRNWLVREEMG